LFDEGEGPIISNALVEHANKYLHEWGLKIHDAHSGIGTNVLSQSDHLKLRNHVFSTSNNIRMDFNVSWTTCTATFVRQDTLQKRYICDLQADDANGPSEEVPNSTILSIVIQPGRCKEENKHTAQAAVGN
jgi:hypothetical protein